MRQFGQFQFPKGVSVSQVLGFCCLSIAMVLLATTPAMAQFSDGKIVGTVYDSSKAAIPGATVVVKDERTGGERTVVTNELGAYTAAQLKPSTYSVTVSASGFENKTLSGITVGVGQARTADFTVNPAGNNEQITVSEMVTVDTTSARVGVNVSATKSMNCRSTDARFRSSIC